jgi:2-methylcitrate dehydratase PrpD
VSSADCNRADHVSSAEILGSYVASSRIDDIPPDVRHEARRALLNFIGCAVGAAAEDAVSIAIRVLMPFAGGGTAAILGRKERLDPLRAALVNGISSHVLDFDDTTPKPIATRRRPSPLRCLAMPVRAR